MKLIQIVAVLASMASMASAIAIDPQGPVNAAELKGRVAGKFSNTLFTSRSNNIQRCVQEMNVQSHTQLPKEVSWPQMLGCASLANVTQTLKTKSQ